jgi:hypothetical protein
VLGGMADGIQTIAKGFRKTEEQAIDAANGIQKDLHNKTDFK